MEGTGDYVGVFVQKESDEEENQKLGKRQTRKLQ